MDALLIEKRLATAILACVANYYATTFSLWVGHWFSHRRGSPFWGFHVLGHHALYPTSRHILSDKFRYGSGKHDSIFALIPWLVLEVMLAFLALPGGLFLAWVLETVLITAAFSYLHMHFHLRDSRLAGFGWFRQARRLHAFHHDWDRNFMVGDHFWDRCLGTHLSPPRGMADSAGGEITGFPPP